MDNQGIITKHSPTHGTTKVSAALRQIETVRERQGLFLSIRPKTILPLGEDRIQERLKDRREQLILNVTEACNFRCSYCVFGGKYPYHRTHSAKAMSWDVARLAIDDFLSHSRLSEERIISFYGGEPLLNLPLIRQCVDHVKRSYADLHVRFSVTTNGYLVKGEAARLLAEEDFLIVISLDGPPEVHDHHRRTKDGSPTWAQVTLNIQNLLAAHPKYRTNGQIKFNAVVTRATDLCQVQTFFGSCDLFADSMGVEVNEQKQIAGSPERFLRDDPLIVSRNVLYEDFIASLKSGRFGDQHADRSRWVQAAVFHKPFVTFHKRGYLSSPLPEKTGFLNTCVPGARRTFVNASGDYFACERVLESEEGVIGNVKEGIDAARVAALLERWTQASQDQCRYCWCLPICRVGCFATLGGDGKMTRESKRQACAGFRRSTHYLVAAYSAVLEENPKAFDYAAGIEFR